MINKAWAKLSVLTRFSLIINHRSSPFPLQLLVDSVTMVGLLFTKSYFSRPQLQLLNLTDCYLKMFHNIWSFTIHTDDGKLWTNSGRNNSLRYWENVYRVNLILHAETNYKWWNKQNKRSYLSSVIQPILSSAKPIWSLVNAE